MLQKNPNNFLANEISTIKFPFKNLQIKKPFRISVPKKKKKKIQNDPQICYLENKQQGLCLGFQVGKKSSLRQKSILATKWGHSMAGFSQGPQLFWGKKI